MTPIKLAAFKLCMVSYSELNGKTTQTEMRFLIMHERPEGIPVIRFVQIWDMYLGRLPANFGRTQILPPVLESFDTEPKHYEKRVLYRTRKK